MKSIGAFVRLARFKFLLGGFLGAALGTAVAGYERGTISIVAYLLAQFTISAAHLMTQLANEYFDLASDARTVRTPFSGGSGVLVDGSLAPIVAITAARACLFASVCGVVALLATGHEAAAWLGAAIVPLAWAYSAPPARLLARGLGEADTMLVVGVLVPLCAYAAQAGELDARALATTLPGAAAMLAMMVTVQVPDLHADAQTGKRNLVVRFGTQAAGAIGLAALATVVFTAFVSLWFGAPRSVLGFESIALVPMAFAAYGFVQLVRGQAVDLVALATAGVATPACVCALGVAGYALSGFVGNAH
jgi:1,4-dihydroxy-2-naphthoate octaprenyltransferase